MQLHQSRWWDSQRGRQSRRLRVPLGTNVYVCVWTSTPIGAWKLNFPLFAVIIIDGPTNRSTDMTDRSTDRPGQREVLLPIIVHSIHQVGSEVHKWKPSAIKHPSWDIPEIPWHNWGTAQGQVFASCRGPLSGSSSARSRRERGSRLETIKSVHTHFKNNRILTFHFWS